MITGVNTVYEHGGKQYHLQAEDLGEAQARFEVRVYDGGTVLWKKQCRFPIINHFFCTVIRMIYYVKLQKDPDWLLKIRVLRK